MVSKERCQCYLGLLLTPCIICLVVWLTIRSSPPGFSIHKFTVPVLNQTSSSFNSSRIINATISFEAKLKNENKEKGIYYDALNLTLYYYHENKSSFLPIGNLSLPPFYQGREKTATRSNTTQTYGVPWDYARMKVSNGSKSKALFRVDLETKVRYKSLLWKSKRHKISETVNITVDDQGKSCANSLHFKYLLLSNQVASTIVGMVLSSSILLLL